MTNEEAKAFLDNLKISINEHPIVADWLVEIANRKTEPTGYNLSPVEDEPTISKMEQVDKDINVRSKTEPKTQMKTQNSNLTFEKDECAKEYEELGLKELKELIEAERKTESDSEIPNNCEHITEDGVTCAKYPACDDCLDNPLNKVKGSEKLLKGKDEPMETTDYCDICKRDMCEICIADATNPYCVPSHYEISYEPKDEPQNHSGEVTEMVKTEPQTDCAWR